MGLAPIRNAITSLSKYDVNNCDCLCWGYCKYSRQAHTSSITKQTNGKMAEKPCCSCFTSNIYGASKHTYCCCCSDSTKCSAYAQELHFPSISETENVFLALLNLHFYHVQDNASPLLWIKDSHKRSLMQIQFETETIPSHASIEICWCCTAQ